MTNVKTEPFKLLDAVDELDVTAGLFRALDMALENDDSQNSEALRQLLCVIEHKVRAVRTNLDRLRTGVQA